MARSNALLLCRRVARKRGQPPNSEVVVLIAVDLSKLRQKWVCSETSSSFTFCDATFTKENLQGT